MGVIGSCPGLRQAWGLAGSFGSMSTAKLVLRPIITPNIVMITSGIYGIGLIFGYWPCPTQAKLNPVESLRYQ